MLIDVGLEEEGALPFASLSPEDQEEVLDSLHILRQGFLYSVPGPFSFLLGEEVRRHLALSSEEAQEHPEMARVLEHACCRDELSRAVLDCLTGRRTVEEAGVRLLRARVTKALGEMRQEMRKSVAESLLDEEVGLQEVLEEEGLSLDDLEEMGMVPEEVAEAQLALHLQEQAIEELSELILIQREEGSEMQGYRAPLSISERYGFAAMRVLQRALAMAWHSEEAVEMEMEAAQWQFRRWSALPNRVEDPEDEAFVTRSREWCLTERPQITQGAVPFLDDFKDLEAYDWLPGLQKQALESFLESRGDLYWFKREEETYLSYESLLTGARYRVLADEDRVGGKHGVAAGRLLQIGDSGEYACSPGLAHYPGMRREDGERMARVAEDIEKEGIQLPLAIEAVLAMHIYKTRVPRPVLAAESPADALEALRAAQEILREAGLSLPTGESALVAEVEELGKQGRRMEAEAFEIDPTIAEWFHALSEQARSLVRSRTGGKKSKKRGSERKVRKRR